jgi:hypothetical protein
MNKQKHIHKYIRIQYGGERIVKDPETGKKKLVQNPKTEVYKCVSCKTYKEKILTLGEEVICWACNQPMIMTKESIKRAKPIHFTCIKIKGN